MQFKAWYSFLNVLQEDALRLGWLGVRKTKLCNFSCALPLRSPAVPRKEDPYQLRDSLRAK